MKMIYRKTLKDGRRQMLIELAKGEPLPVEPLDLDGFYRLNYPHEDEILQGYHINNPTRVYWDTIGQKWEDAK